MPREKNTLLRIVVPLVVGILGVGIALTFFVTKSRSENTGIVTQDPVGYKHPAKDEKSAAPANPDAAGAVTQTPAPAPAPAGVTGSVQGTAPVAAPVAPAVTPTTEAVGKYRAVPQGSAAGSAGGAVLGTLDRKGAQTMQLTLTADGAGVENITLARHFDSILENDPTLLQRRHVAPNGSTVVPFAAGAVKIIGADGGFTIVPIFRDTAASLPLWRLVAKTDLSATYEALIVDANNQPALRITRVWSLQNDSYDIGLKQTIDNLSGAPLSVQLYQYGPVEPANERTGSQGVLDSRKVRFGYLLNKDKDPGQVSVLSNSYTHVHKDVVGSRGADGLFPERPLWPMDVNTKSGETMTWTGITNRYFGVAAYPGDARVKDVPRVWSWVQGVTGIVLDEGAGAETIALRLDSKPVAVAAGQSTDLSMGVYAGPLDQRAMGSIASLKAFGLDGLVVFNLGGFCGPCTFEFMTTGLRWVLYALHDFIFRDWAVAIIFLVVLVRSVLHPVTRWSQIRMARFGKQMSAIGPKQKEIQERYKDDKAKIQSETARLWREEGISPTGFLGCLPMFLQTPVWIALYATLFFSIELRHAGAFYGVFQNIQPQSSPFWRFLGDLAEPDRFFYFQNAFEVPLLSGLMGPIHSVNLLPVVLGVVFWLQQKYVQTTPTTPMTPEQEMQQKIMKWMMVFMFPVMMYNQASGLVLYFIANSTLGILESKWVKMYIDKHDLLNMDKIRAAKSVVNGRPGKPGASTGGGFMERMQKAIEERQRQAQQKSKGKK